MLFFLLQLSDDQRNCPNQKKYREHNRHVLSITQLERGGEMPVEAMTTPTSTVVSIPGLCSQGNILFSLQSKAYFILPKQPEISIYMA